MALKLPAPALGWSAAYQIRLNQAAESEDIRNLKRGQNIEIFPPQKLTLHSPDGKAWDVTVTNAGQIMPDLGGGGTGTVTSVGTGTGLTGGPITGAGVISLANTAVTPGNYLNANITVDQQGRITAAANGAAGGGGSITSITATPPLTGGTITTVGSIGLADTAVTPGSYTKANITIDAKGRITAAANGADTFIGTVTSVGSGTGLTGGPITGAGTLALANTAVTPGPYTNANITVDQQGRITAAANGPAPGVGTVTSVGSGTGLTGGPITGAGTLALANTAVTPGPYTKANITVDQQGRITAASNGTDSFVGTVTSVGSGTGLTGGPITGAGTLALADTAVAPGVYTKANITVDQQGRITAAANGADSFVGTVTSVATGTGLTGGPVTSTGTIRLADTAVTPGTYTKASITVDQQGRLTAASSGAADPVPGGANTQVQFNNSGAFGGSANLVWNGTNLVVGGSVVPLVDVSTNLGSTSVRWNNVYGQNFAASGAAAAFDAYDRAVANQYSVFWRNNGVGALWDVSLTPSAGNIIEWTGTSGDVRIRGALSPMADNTKALGSASFRWASLNTDQLNSDLIKFFNAAGTTQAGFWNGTNGNLVIMGTSAAINMRERSGGTNQMAFYRSANQGICFDGGFANNIWSYDGTSANMTFAGALLPATDISKALGSATQRWFSLYANDIRLVGTSGILFDGTPTINMSGDYLQLINGTKAIFVAKSPTATSYYRNTVHVFDDGGSAFATINSSGLSTNLNVTANIIAGNLVMAYARTVAALPAAASYAGVTCYVTDAATAGLAWGAPIGAGGGANKYLVWSNGTNWTVTGK